MGKNKETEPVQVKFNLQAVAAGIRMPSGNEMQIASGHLLMDVVLVTNPNAVMVGHIAIPALKPMTIGKKFNVKLTFEELSEDEYTSLVTAGLIEVGGDKNKNVGVI